MTLENNFYADRFQTFEGAQESEKLKNGTTEQTFYGARLFDLRVGKQQYKFIKVMVLEVNLTSINLY